jgi:ParB-like chromosome segregation protein Spo0J
MIADDLTPLVRPIKSLKPLPGNPRRGDVDAVARSYERFGQRKPIVALKDGTVIAGNHQLAAAKKLGWKEIAVVYVDDDNETAKAFALADNRIADLGTYDSEQLMAMLTEISDNTELLLATGYGEHFLDDLKMALAAPPSLDDLADTWSPSEPSEDSGKTTVTLSLDKDTASDLRAYLVEVGDDSVAIGRLLAR